MGERVPSLAGTGLVAGEILLGKYRVERMLGKGGMGFVVLATHLGLGQKVAIKMLHAVSALRPQVVARFLFEARAAALIENDHVVRVMDVGELPDGAPYIVMEYLSGRDLADVLAERGRLEIGETVDAVLEACEALAAAHARGVVHRDLKPANLFLANRADGTTIIKLVDFGISKAIAPESASDLSLTGSDVFIGSPRYMSPEQLKSARDVDARADIWSLGVILYELATGSLPFDGASALSLSAQIASEPPIPIERMLAGAPPELSSAIARCLEKDRAKRFKDVRELAEAIFTLSRSAHVDLNMEKIRRASFVAPRAEVEPTHLRAPRVTALAQPPQATESSFVEPVQPPKRAAVLWIGVALILIVAAVFFITQRDRAREPEPEREREPVPVIVENPPEPAPEPQTKTKPQKAKPQRDALDLQPY